MNIFIAIFILGVLLPLAYAGKSMAPWVPTRKRDIERLLQILPLKPAETFFEIGCGDARVSDAVAKKFPESQVVAIELAFPLYFIAKIRELFHPNKNLAIMFGDAFKKDFSNYDVIYVYGMPDKMSSKIIPKFLAEAKPGAKLYSYVFSIPENFSSEEIKTFGAEKQAKIHMIQKS